MILFIAVCDTGGAEQMFGTFVRNFCSTTPTSGSGPPGGTLGVGGHVSAAHNYSSKGGAPRRQAPPEGKGGKE